MAVSKISRPGTVEDISSLYTVTKTGGNYSVTTITAYRSGKQVFVNLSGTNSASTTAGSNVFTGELSGGPLPVLDSATFAGYNGAVGLAATILTDGSFTLRAIGTGSYAGTNVTSYARFSFLTE